MGEVSLVGTGSGDFGSSWVFKARFTSTRRAIWHGLCQSHFHVWGFFLVTRWAIMKPWSTAYSTRHFRALIPTNPPISLCINLKVCTTAWQSSLLYTHTHLHTHTHEHALPFLLTSRNIEEERALLCWRWFDDFLQAAFERNTRIYP